MKPCSRSLFVRCLGMACFTPLFSSSVQRIQWLGIFSPTVSLEFCLFSDGKYPDMYLLFILQLRISLLVAPLHLHITFCSFQKPFYDDSWRTCWFGKRREVLGSSMVKESKACSVPHFTFLEFRLTIYLLFIPKSISQWQLALLLIQEASGGVAG